MTAFDSASGEWDEDGFHLRIGDSDGEVSDVRIGGLGEAEELLAALEPLRHWVREGRYEEREFLRASAVERLRVLGLAVHDDPVEACRVAADVLRKRDREEGS